MIFHAKLSNLLCPFVLPDPRSRGDLLWLHQEMYRNEDKAAWRHFDEFPRGNSGVGFEGCRHADSRLNLHILLVRLFRREWMGCWGLLGWLLLVMTGIIPENSLLPSHCWFCDFPDGKSITESVASPDIERVDVVGTTLEGTPYVTVAQEQ